MRKALISLACLAASAATPAVAFPADPLQSPMWEAHARTLFGKDPVAFDPQVRVRVPDLAENQRVFPVEVDARGLGDIRRIILFADLNPIPIAVDYRPGSAAPFLATRIKLDQRTPVRAAVQRADGQWLVSGLWVDAAGGGCSAPPVSRVRGDWADHLGEVRGRAWAGDAAAPGRLRLNFRHPMDTGLVENIPTYHLEHVDVADEAGDPLGSLDLWASVAEDPVLTLMPRAAHGSIAVTARDSGGRVYSARIPVEPAR